MAEAEQLSNIPSVDDTVGPKEALEEQLDRHLGRYLHILEQYQTLREALSKDFASGSLSLAQANFSNPNHVRYGQDYYDERMKAACQFSIDLSSPSSSNHFTFVERALSLSKDEDSKSIPADPIKWFGFLTPSALKVSQRDFKGVVSLVPTIASVMSEMRDVEIQVRRTRKKLSKLP